MKVLKCLQHDLTKEQIRDLCSVFEYVYDIEASDIEDLKDVDKELYTSLINTPDNVSEIKRLAEELYGLTTDYDTVILPIGSPAFMFRFARILGLYGTTCNFLFSHSERVVEEVKKDNGSVEKKSVFKHKKWLAYESIIGDGR